MKKIACLLLVLLSLKGFSQNVNDSLATIVFFRNASSTGSAASLKLTDGLGTVIHLYNNSYYVYHCKPGNYQFLINGKKKNAIKGTAKAGKTYYYEAMLYSSFWDMQFEVEEVDSSKANRSLSKRPHLDLNKPLNKPKNRIGVAVGAGGGFTRETVATTTDGGDVTLSFGGGAGIGGYIGRELNKYLDLEIAYRHFNGGLSPNITNGSMEFSRHIISITPAFIIPIRGGYTKRVKLGLGADIYIGSKLELDVPVVNPPDPPFQLNDTWKYSDAFGYHISAVYEVNVSRHWCFFYGARYYAVKYSFASGNTTFPTDDFFVKPNGSGLDFIFGAGFHF